MTERCDESKCADLIRAGQKLGGLGGARLVGPDEDYTDAEIRVANETIRRMRGDRYLITRGLITMNYEATAPTPFKHIQTRVSWWPQ